MKRTTIGILALAAWEMGVAAGMGENGHLVMRVDMASAEVAVGEPVAFALEFDNPEGSQESVALGYNGMGNVRIELSDGRATRRFNPPPREGGVSLDPCLTPIPGRPAFEGLFLDDFVQGGLEPGEYRMSVSLVESPHIDFIPPPKGTRWVLPAPAEASFRVVEAAEGVRPDVEKRLARWLDAALSDEDPVWRSWIARRAILLSRHPAAEEIQLTWLRDAAWSGFDEFRLLADALLDPGRVDALEALVSALSGNPECDGWERNVLLDSLRRHGVAEWEDERRAMIEPWREQIREAGAMGIISD